MINIPEKQDLWMAKFAGPLAGCTLTYNPLIVTPRVEQRGHTYTAFDINNSVKTSVT